MAERWFSDEELDEMSRPTMDRAIEAIEAGDLEQAKALCEAMKHEWRFLHDMMVDGIAASMTLGQGALRRGGGRRVAALGHGALLEAQRERDRQARPQGDRASCSPPRGARTRPAAPDRSPAPSTIEEDDEKVTFRMNPCGSGQRLWRMGRYEGEDGHAVMEEEHDWAYNRKGFPIYCTHCTFMNEILPIQWIGYPVYPSDPPGDFDRDPCTWYWYKDPADIPDRHWERYGLERQLAIRSHPLGGG